MKTKNNWYTIMLISGNEEKVVWMDLKDEKPETFRKQTFEIDGKTWKVATLSKVN